MRDYRELSEFSLYSNRPKKVKEIREQSKNSFRKLHLVTVEELSVHTSLYLYRPEKVNKIREQGKLSCGKLLELHTVLLGSHWCASKICS